MNNYFIVNQTDPDTGKVVRSKKIYELKKNELMNYKLIGSSSGVSFEHCFYLGSKHADNFWGRVYGYLIEDREGSLAEMIDRAYVQVGLKKSRTISIGFFELI